MFQKKNVHNIKNCVARLYFDFEENIPFFLILYTVFGYSKNKHNSYFRSYKSK